MACAPCPARDSNCGVRPVVDAQELTGARSGVSYWEGAIDVEGTRAGQPSHGPGLSRDDGVRGPRAGRTAQPASFSNPSKSALNSPVRQKFSGCHWTPRQNGRSGRSIASITPSGAVALDDETRRERLDRLMMAAVHQRASSLESGQPSVQPASCPTSPTLRARWRSASSPRGGRVRRAPRVGMSWTSEPPARDVEHLHAAADGEQRQSAIDGHAHQRQLELVASRLGGRERRVASPRRRNRGSTSPPPVSTSASTPSSAASALGEGRVEGAHRRAGTRIDSS